MGTTAQARRTEVENLETTLRIRERIVRVTAEKLLEAIDRGEPTDLLVASLRDAVAEAIAADDRHFLAVFGVAKPGAAA